MPTTTTITRNQRAGIYELVRNHLGSVGDLWIALEERRDYASAERLGIELAEDVRLLADIGWNPGEERESFELTMPVHDLAGKLDNHLRPQVVPEAQFRPGREKAAGDSPRRPHIVLLV